MARVLLVDDEPNIRWTLAEFLRRQGFDPVTAPDYESAVGILRNQDVDVAVVDILLPGKSGIDLLKEICGWQKYIPVLMMTGEPDVERLPEILRAGACDYMTKPVVKDALIEAVSRALDKKHAVDEKARLDREIRSHAQELERLIQERTHDLATIERANSVAMKSLQEKLENSERSALLGRAAAQIAHEVKNPLAGLRLYAFHLKSKISDSARKSEIDLINKIIQTLDHLSEIVEKTLDFARPVSLSKIRLDINRILNESLQVLEPQLRADNILVDERLAPGDLTCLADKALISSVLVNVILNAIQAMPGGGRLTLKSETTGGFITVEVADTGGGIEPEDFENVFEPFYTTKSRGLGLGLPYARKVVEQHAGTIDISSQPGQGTRLIVKLPAED
jgi:signal transduction histidine kinase